MPMPAAVKSRGRFAGEVDVTEVDVPTFGPKQASQDQAEFTLTVPLDASEPDDLPGPQRQGHGIEP